MANLNSNVNSLSLVSRLSVIVPFLGHDVFWKDLLQDLKFLPSGSEILLVGPDAPDKEILAKSREGLIAKLSYVPSLKGRANQLNAGARAAQREFLWFLHADTKVPRPAIYTLERFLQTEPLALHYFKLQFLDDGPRMVRLNALAANMRTKYLLMPFGDQGFAMHRSTFYRVGGFDATVPYGEDHVFVWEARRKNIKLSLLPASLFTSARSYEQKGWGRLTGLRVYLTAKQALAEGAKLYRQRLLEKWMPHA